MTDILDQAKNFLKGCCPYETREVELIEGLMAECEALVVALRQMTGEHNLAVIRANTTEAECERLQEKYDKMKTAFLDLNKANHARHSEIRNLEDELARWQKIVIDLKADVIRDRDDGFTFGGKGIDPYEQAVKELGIPISDHIVEANQLIRQGGKEVAWQDIPDNQPTMVLTKEQKDVIEEIIESIMSHPCDRGLDQWHADILRDMLDPSQPVWGITEIRKAALEHATNTFSLVVNHNYPGIQGDIDTLRLMLEECEK